MQISSKPSGRHELGAGRIAPLEYRSQ